MAHSTKLAYQVLFIIVVVPLVVVVVEIIISPYMIITYDRPTGGLTFEV